MLANVKTIKSDQSMLSMKTQAIHTNQSNQTLQTNQNIVKKDLNSNYREKHTTEHMILEMTNAINTFYIDSHDKDIKQNKEVEDFKKFFFPGLEKILNQILKSITADKERAEKIETVYKFFKGKSEYLKQIQLSKEKESNKNNINNNNDNILNLASNPNSFKKEYKDKEKLKMPTNYIYDNKQPIKNDDPKYIAR